MGLVRKAHFYKSKAITLPIFVIFVTDRLLTAE